MEVIISKYLSCYIAIVSRSEDWVCGMFAINVENLGSKLVVVLCRIKLPSGKCITSDVQGLRLGAVAFRVWGSGYRWLVLSAASWFPGRDWL
jgi:hypothetical protein